jgi:hypothetical protein
MLKMVQVLAQTEYCSISETIKLLVSDLGNEIEKRKWNLPPNKKILSPLKPQALAAYRLMFTEQIEVQASSSIEYRSQVSVTSLTLSFPQIT